MKSDIILAGVGGQGILSIATVIGVAALEDNLYLKQAEVHGMSQRGGDVQSNLRLSSEPIASDLIPLGQADLIVSMEPMEGLRYLPYLKKEGWLVTNTVPFVNIKNYPSSEALAEEMKKVDNLIAFDMDAVAKEVGSPRSSNMVLLGAISPLISIEEPHLINGIRKIFSSKGDAITEMNIAAFAKGRDYTVEFLKNR
ncbi:MAG: indolepyruvate oxidoreductase subunit beta [Muribaculaceae bacterium]|nr:indolepyruvate oxidoreductase subunit beta [Muribaculaceae bacterium]